MNQVQDSRMDCEANSKEAKAIALATTALFKLKGHSADCKEAMSKSGGIQAAVMALKEDSGIKADAKQIITQMLSAYVSQNNRNVASITANGGVKVLLVFSQGKGLPEPVQERVEGYCCAVVEACLQHDATLNSHQVQRMRKAAAHKQLLADCSTEI